MGQEFCSGCEDNCLSNLENDFSNNNNMNKPEENIIFKNTDFYFPTNQSLLTQNKIDDVKNTETCDEIPYYINKMNHPYMFNKDVDKKKLYEIILKYKIILLIKYFRKFKSLKYRILKEVVIENYYSNPLDSIENNNNNKNIYQQPEIDISPKSNYIFIGHKFNGKKESYGLEIYSDINARYFGGFKNGRKSGFCRFSIYNIEKTYYYFGEVLDNKISGFGYFENCKNSTKYEGEWKNSLRNGYGIEYYDDGSFYKGEFINGTKFGIGVYIWVDKTSYEGEWLNNFIHGYGKYVFANGSIYKGKWNYNKKDGLGELWYPSQKTYFGFFKEDIRSGLGMLFSSEDRKAFIGFWKNNKQNGLGQFINNNKCIYGRWENGKLIKKIEEKEFFNSFSNLEKIYKNNFTAHNFRDFQQKISYIYKK